MITEKELEEATEFNEYTSDQKENIIKHKKFTRTVHVWVVNPKKELLMQKRSDRRIFYPNRWDIALEDNLKEGESVIDGAIRIARKRIKLDVVKEDLEYVGTVRNLKYKYDMEFRYIYIMRCNKRINEYIYKTKDIADLRYFNFEKLEEMIKRRKKSIIKHYSEYEMVFQYIRNFLD